MKESSENTAPEFFVVKSKGIAASVLNVNLDGVAPEKKIPKHSQRLLLKGLSQLRNRRTRAL